MGKVKNWTVEKKDEIERILIDMWASLGMDIPDNYEDIVQDCYEDVCETADPVNWHSGDVAIAFRRWIEKQASENVREPMSEGEVGLDGTYGVKLDTLGDLLPMLTELSEDDQICIETCDEYGDVVDLFPVALDVISGIQLTNGKTVNEIRFCQRPNSEPDTRDKQPVVDALIDVLADDIAKGDVTVLDELLLRMPYDVLKYALPEDMWADFENFKGESNE